MARKTSLNKWIGAASNFISLITSLWNVEKCFWSWILKYCIKVYETKKKFVVLCSLSRRNVNTGTFTLWSYKDSKEMYKIAWCTRLQICCYVVNQNLSFFAVLVDIAVKCSVDLSQSVSLSLFSMPSKGDNNTNRVDVLEHKFSLGPAYSVHYESGVQNIFLPANINCFVLL